MCNTCTCSSDKTVTVTSSEIKSRVNNIYCFCETICLAKLHLLSHCIHSGDISKHSCFSVLFRTSSWHSSRPSNSSFLL